MSLKYEQIIKGYLKELNFKEDIKNIEDITKLIKVHLCTFAFSSFSVLLKNEISLELEDIYEKIVLNKKGGYCFEHNKLFYEVLKYFGFDVEYYMARVINNTDSIPPQTHRFTLLNYESERYLLDVGVGFRSPVVPVKFSKEITKGNLGIDYKIEKFADSFYSFQLIEDNDLFNVTKFDLYPCFEVDFELGHFYSHKHDKAVFVNNLVISLITNTHINSLRNKDYLRIYENKTEKIVIDSLEKFKEILENDFNSYFNENEVESIYKKYII